MSILKVRDKDGKFVDIPVISGRPASIKVGEVKLLEPNSEPTIENVGTEYDAIFNFGIPKGEYIVQGENFKLDLSDYVKQKQLDKEIQNRQQTDDSLQSQIKSLASGSPLVADSTDEMTDKKRVYVNTSDGNWYYYNGSAWINGGVYQATAIDDGSILYKHLNNKLTDTLNLKEKIINLEYVIGSISGISTGNPGVSTNVTNRLRSNFYEFKNQITVILNTDYKIKIFEYNSCDEKNYSRESNWLSKDISFDFETTKYYKFVLSRKDDKDIDISEGVNLSLSEITFNYEQTDIINLNDDLKKLLNISKLNLTFVNGSLSGSAGVEINSSNRIRSNFFKTITNIKLRNNLNYRFKLFEYNLKKQFVSATDWIYKTYYEHEYDSNKYYRIIIAKLDDTSITTDESENVSIESYCLTTEKEGEFITESRDLFLASRNLYFSEGSYMSGITLVKNLLVCFGVSPDDNQTYVNGLIYKIDVENEEFIYVSTFTHNLGHVNSVDYCIENDSLVFGNGSGDFDLKGKFYVMENFYSRISNVENPVLSLSDCIEYDCSDYELGNEYKFNCCWSDGNLGNYDTIILVTNNFRNIRKIQLGRNANNLGLGNYLETNNNKFNGSFKIQQEYTQDTYGAIDRDNTYCVQDLSYYDHKLYAGVGHGIRSYWIMNLKHDGSIEREEKQFDAYSNAGEPYNTTGSAIEVTDRYLILGSGRILVYNK